MGETVGASLITTTWSHIPNAGVVSYASNMPKYDVRLGLDIGQGLFGRLHPNIHSCTHVGAQKGCLLGSPGVPMGSDSYREPAYSFIQDWLDAQLTS